MKNILSILIIILITSCASKKIIQKDTSSKPSPEKELRFKLTRKENMPFGAYDFGAELYKGKIYAFLDHARNRYGKEDGNHGDVCVFNIDKGQWSKINVIPKSQEGASSVLIKNKIYLIGGRNFSDLVQVYNIETNNWEESFHLPIGLYWTTVEAYKESFYVIGGYADGVNGDGVRTLNNVQIYNTNTKKWTEGATYPRKSQLLNSLNYMNEFYVWGGGKIYKYIPKRDMWFTEQSLMYKLKDSQEGVVLNNEFIFINGQNGTSLKDKATKQIFSYNPKTKVFKESIDNLITGRHYSYNVFEYKNKVYILGGREDQEWKSMNDVIELEIHN